MTQHYKILVVAPSWVGDMVMAQTLFRRLHELHANLQLDVLAPDWTLPLLARMPEVREAIPNPFGHGEFRLGARIKLGRSLRKRAYHQAIVLPNSWKSALIPFFAGIPLRTGFLGEARWGLLNDARKLNKTALPLMVQRFVALAGRADSPLAPSIPAMALAVDENRRQSTLSKLGLNAPPLPPLPERSRRQGEGANASGRKIAALCVGAEFGPAKRWPPKHFAALAGALAQEGFQVWVVGSAKDATAGEEVARLASASACLNLCGLSNLDEAVDLLASASVVVSNDSGLMHVAAALNKPLIALYGSSSPGFTPPLSEQARIVSLNLPCSPCFQRECPLGHLDCLNKLSPQSILDEIHSFARKTPSPQPSPQQGEGGY